MVGFLGLPVGSYDLPRGILGFQYFNFFIKNKFYLNDNWLFAQTGSDLKTMKIGPISPVL